MDDDTRSDDLGDDGGPPTQRMRPEDFDDAAPDATQRMSGGTDDFPTRRFDPATPLPVAHTEILEIPPDPRAGRATGLAASFVVLAFIAAALLGYTTRVPHPPGLVGRALIRPDGGVIAFDDTGRVEIPSGALSTATTITIRKVKLNQDIRLTRANQPDVQFKKGDVDLYTFEPNGTTFNQPVTIRLPLRTDGDAALVVTSSDVRVISGSRQGNTFVVQTTNFDFR